MAVLRLGREGFGYRTRNDSVLVADVAGYTEEVARPDGSSPFETAVPAKAAVRPERPRRLLRTAPLP